VRLRYVLIEILVVEVMKDGAGGSPAVASLLRH
jgi:hypothetical protein